MGADHSQVLQLIRSRSDYTPRSRKPTRTGTPRVLRADVIGAGKAVVSCSRVMMRPESFSFFFLFFFVLSLSR